MVRYILAVANAQRSVGDQSPACLHRVKASLSSENDYFEEAQPVHAFHITLRTLSHQQRMPSRSNVAHGLGEHTWQSEAPAYSTVTPSRNVAAARSAAVISDLLLRALPLVSGCAGAALLPPSPLAFCGCARARSFISCRARIAASAPPKLKASVKAATRAVCPGGARRPGLSQSLMRKMRILNACQTPEGNLMMSHIMQVKLTCGMSSTRCQMDLMLWCQHPTSRYKSGRHQIADALLLLLLRCKACTPPCHCGFG